ncbi:protein regulator of cytokinesis 1-like isoform X5 [Oncorhynchus nerka]|uniref:protein regulator of cytokinesis 1-like isoform X5 n=1 Tax=Oncorhynchus nerka TaxID=8023 RepID=UPI0031B8318B
MFVLRPERNVCSTSGEECLFYLTSFYVGRGMFVLRRERNVCSTSGEECLFYVGRGMFVLRRERNVCSTSGEECLFYVGRGMFVLRPERNVCSTSGEECLFYLEDRKTENELVCNSYRSKIQELWERLQVLQEEREGMSDHMVQSRKRNMDALEAECRRLDELKMKNMKSVIEAIRAEVALFWERCFYSLAQRRAFTPYYDVDFTVELLNLHEAELLSLKKHYEDHRELFEGVTRWQDSWTLFLQLEKKVTDPSRFNNRGGNLLKEEKQRADLQKSLPKLEKSLKTQVDLWEEEQSREFLVNGQRFLQYVEEQWELLQLEKERGKNERQLKKNQQIEHDLLYGTVQRTPSKRRLAGTPTPGKARKLNAASSIYGSTPNGTLRSAFGGTLCQSPALRLPMSASKLPLRTPSCVGRTPRTVERNKENISHLNGPALSGVLRNPAQSPASHRKISVNSVASTYSEFSRFLSNASKSVKTGHLNSTVTNL